MYQLGPKALIHSQFFNSMNFYYKGNAVVVEDSPIGRLGLTVCYDLRFPELYQMLRFHHQAQVQSLLMMHLLPYPKFSVVININIIFVGKVLLVPSAFTKVTGEAHWEILLRARAIETQCYVIRFFCLFQLLQL
jgi:deaminated glutathione amidase